VNAATRLGSALVVAFAIVQPAMGAAPNQTLSPSVRDRSIAYLERAVEGAAQACARELPATRGPSVIHLRISLEPAGGVRAIAPFDQVAEPVPDAVMRCLRRASSGWKTPAGTGRVIELTPTSELYPRDVLLVALEGGQTAIHYEDELPVGYRTAAWWAVCARAEGPVLAPVKLSIEEVHCEDEGGRQIRVSEGCEQPIFLVKGAGRAEPRPLTTASVGRTVRDEGHNTVTFDNRTWRLATAGDDVFLEGNGRRQWLLKRPAKTFFPLDGRGRGLDKRRPTKVRPRVDVRWAGDLDGDGRLDLLLESSDETSFDFLFLSSLARRGEIVHPAALAWRSACHG